MIQFVLDTVSCSPVPSIHLLPKVAYTRSNSSQWLPPFTDCNLCTDQGRSLSRRLIRTRSGDAKILNHDKQKKAPLFKKIFSSKLFAFFEIIELSPRRHDYLLHDRAVSQNKNHIFSLITNVLFWFQFYLIFIPFFYLKRLVFNLNRCLMKIGEKVICFMMKLSIATLNSLTYNYISNANLTTLRFLETLIKSLWYSILRISIFCVEFIKYIKIENPD
jgi:hypothetical protein